MHRKFIFVAAVMALIALTSVAVWSGTRSNNVKTESMQKRVSFKVRGNGKTNVQLGIGYQVGSGACCTGVSKESTVSFTGNTGDVLYDSATKRVITKVYDGLEGSVVDLRQYY